MSVQILQNVKGFLERSPATGLECYAWCEAHAYIVQCIRELQKTEAASESDQMDD